MSEQPGSLRYPVKASTGARANDRRQSSGARRVGVPTALPFSYTQDVLVTYSGGSDTIPRGTLAVLWQGDQASSDTAAVTGLDMTASRYVLFTVTGSGKLYATPQENWSTASGAASVIGLEYSHWDGWQRWQMRAQPFAPCLGFSPTIELVAGGNDWNVGSDTTNGTVDGGLGSGKMNAPSEAVFGPDGKLYFKDQGTNFIRFFNPATGALATSTISLNRGAGFREPAKTFAIGPDGRFYLFLNAADDNDSPSIVSVNPDNSTGNFSYQWFDSSSKIGNASNMFVAPDNSCLYVPVPKVSPYSTFFGSGTSSATYTITRIAINSDGSAGAVTTYAGIPGEIPSNHSGLTPNGQGEDVAATSGQVGNVVNCYCEPHGHLYTICDHTRMVRRIDFGTHHIRSMTNHVPLLSTGSFPGDIASGGYNGDGLASFTLNDNTAQFGQFMFNSVTVDPCGNTFISDFHVAADGDYLLPGSVGASALVRYVDTDGLLHTIVGQVPDVDNTLPTAMPHDASTVTIYGSKWIAWGPDGSLYITSAFCDFAHVSCNAIYKVSSSH